MDIAAWLRGLDLGQYEVAFRDNDIDAAVQPELTTEGLISIGVTSVGHRRRLLSAIAALRTEAPGGASPLPPPGTPALAGGRPGAPLRREGGDAEIHRFRGELTSRLPHPDPAKVEDSFRTALAIASELGTRGYELRAATSLARLWREQGRRTEAHDLLAPLYGWFTEGFDTPDLKEAKRLLNELT